MHETGPTLDLFTIRAMTLLSMFVVSGATMLAWRLNRRAAGLRPFAVGLFLMALGAAAGMVRLTAGWKLAMVLWAGLIFAGMVGVARGVREFRGFPPVGRTVLAPFAGSVVLAFLYWTLGHDSLAMRVGVLSLSYSLVLLDSAVAMLRRVTPGQGLIYRPTGIAFACTSVCMAIRAVSRFSGAQVSYPLSPQTIEIGYTICADLAFILCAFGMLLASNMQLRIEAERMALFDPLDRLLDAELRAISSGHRFALIYLDLDGFKQVNDTLGHSVGDDLLRAVSLAMSSVLHAGHCLARVGGDEFVVLVEDAPSREPVTSLALQLKAAVEAGPSTAMPHVQLSYGIALFPEDGQTAHDIMRLADAAMYRSKRENRPDAIAASETVLSR
jgi:diguanylate cyclase (GGDEF)-like protein